MEKSINFNRKETIELLQKQGFKIELSPGEHTVWDMLDVRADDEFLINIALKNNYEPYAMGMKVTPADPLSVNNKPTAVAVHYFKKQRKVLIDTEGNFVKEV